jgi:hypothetical protein
VPQATVDTDVAFPVRTQPITVACRILITDTTPSGLIFEFGGAHGFGACIEAATEDLHVAAGNGTGPNGVAGTVSLARFATSGHSFGLVVATNPGAGLLIAWVDGEEVIRADGGGAFTSNAWGDTGDGAIGAAATVAAHAGLPTVTAPANFEIASPFSAYDGQLPRQF